MIDVLSEYRARRVTRLGMPSGARAVRVVHELDGILDEVAPKELIRWGRKLWTAWQTPNVRSCLITARW